MILWLKALHVIAIIAWMAGMLYLPRLFVYHAEAARGSEASETFKVMERRLLKAIVNPSMILVFLTGFTLVYLTGDWRDGWWQAKFILVLGHWPILISVSVTPGAFSARVAPKPWAEYAAAAAADCNRKRRVIMSFLP